MNDLGEKTCPLCAEEMDLTDQQLKPCKCGYQICVWCWHHIMDMAEKDETEGRCPACRTPYDKEKIVGMAANCERLASEVNMERKKTQKSKTKPSEGRKQLSSVRVIQRNLVYIVGLPLNLADEDLLQRKEHFGQYGKVLKVSMSRTASGVIQQFPNNTCSVYITYSKEEEAIRCIRSVHGFVLDGRSLKACFGTTKYCHAWLRNMPCNNPDCLYLHEIGLQEDSFTKDEIISAYTRSRVQQITGATNNLQRRSGNTLPPPVDDIITNNSAKPAVETSINKSAGVANSSPPNGSSDRPVALHAAASWATRASNQQSMPNPAPLNGPDNKQRPSSANGILAFSSAGTITARVPVSHGDVLKKLHPEDGSQSIDKSKLDSPNSFLHRAPVDSRSKTPASGNGDPTSNQMLCPVASTYNSRGISMPSISRNSFDCVKEGNAEDDGSIRRLCVDVASIGIDKNFGNDHSGVTISRGTISNQGLVRSPGNEGLEQHYLEEPRDLASSNMFDGRAAISPNSVCVSKPQSDWGTDLQSQVEKYSKSKPDEDILSFDSQRLNDPEVTYHSPYLPNSADQVFMPNHLGFRSSQQNEVLGRVNSSSDSLFLGNRGSDRSLLSNGLAERPVVGSVGSSALEHSLFASEGKKENQLGEDHIISDILSLDFDPWGESLASPQNLVKLLGETDQQASPLKLSNPVKVQHNNQSRFSFARQEESNNKAFEPYAAFGQLSKDQLSFQDSVVGRDPYLDNLRIHNGFTSCYSEGLENFSSSPSLFSSNKISVSRAQISAPPGFSIPSRCPPPGFSSNERMDQTFDGTHLPGSTSLLRDSYQASLPNGKLGASGDIEFIDPAILAVGRGRPQGGLDNASLDMRSSFSSQLNSFENERLNLLMQRTLAAQQGFGFPDIRHNNFSSSLNDSYGIDPRIMDQSQGIGLSGLSSFMQSSGQLSSNSLMPNGHWDRWNEVQGRNNVGVAELLRNERLGFSNTIYNGYEESNFRVSSSGDLYNTTYRM